MDTSEGLVAFRQGYANPIYDGMSGLSSPDRAMFNGDNYQNVFVKISNGINVPSSGISLGNVGDCFNAYSICSPLQAVCNRIAEALMNGKWRIINDDDEDVSKKNARNKRIVQLLRQPNPLQSYADFLKQIAINRNVGGGAFIFASMPAGFNDISQATALWVFSSEEVEVVYTGRLFSASKLSDLVEKYIITPKNGESTFEASPEQVLTILDTTEPPIMLHGRTQGLRVRGLYYDIRNVLQGQEAVYSLNSDRGAQGIISNEARDAMGFVPMTPDEKEALQNRFRSRYGLRRDQDKVYVTDASVKYTPIGFNVKDLMLHEGMRGNVMAICDAFNYPFDLLSSEKGKTAADKRTAMAGLYQDNIIPLADDISAKLTLWFGLNADDNVIQIDYSHLQIFQTGNVERNNALRQLIQALHIAYNGETISRQEFRRMIGLVAEIKEGETMRSETNAQKSRDDVRVTQA